MTDPITRLAGARSVYCRCGRWAGSPMMALLRRWWLGTVWGVICWRCPVCRNRRAK